MKEHPWFKFYVARWLGDPGLRIAGATARGVLIDMMAIAHDGQPYGHVTNAGRPLGAVDLSLIGHDPARKVTSALRTLAKLGCIAQLSDGTYVIPSMVKYSEEHQKHVEHGSRGGNPALTNKVNPPLNPPVKPEVKAEQKRKRERTEQNRGEGDSVLSDFGDSSVKGKDTATAEATAHGGETALQYIEKSAIKEYLDREHNGAAIRQKILSYTPEHIKTCWEYVMGEDQKNTLKKPPLALFQSLLKSGFTGGGSSKRSGETRTRVCPDYGKIHPLGAPCPKCNGRGFWTEDEDGNITVPGPFPAIVPPVPAEREEGKGPTGMGDLMKPYTSPVVTESLVSVTEGGSEVTEEVETVTTAAVEVTEPAEPLDSTGPVPAEGAGVAIEQDLV